MDILKLFAIFLVIYGHAIQHLLSSPAVEHPMFRLLHSFHMPLFMAISGFFAASLRRLAVKEFFVKKGRQLLIPAVSASLLVVLISYVLGDTVSKEYYIYGIWFLKSLFLCSLLYYVSSRFKRYSLMAFMVSLLVSQILPYLYLPTMYPAFLMGAVLRSQWPWFKNHLSVITVISGIAFVGLLLFLDEGDFIQISTTVALKPLLTNGDASQILELASIRYYRVAVGLAGALFFILLFECVVNQLVKRGVSVLSRMGQRTLGVYILQTFILEVGLRKMLNFDGTDAYLFTFVIAPSISLIVLIISLWLSGLCEKNKWTSLFFIGK